MFNHSLFYFDVTLNFITLLVYDLIGFVETCIDKNRLDGRVVGFCNFYTAHRDLLPSEDIDLILKNIAINVKIGISIANFKSINKI